MDDVLGPASDFLRPYLRISPEYLTPDGLVKPNRIGECVAFLIAEEVFEDVEDVKLELLDEYSVILPEWCYKEEFK